MGGWVGAGPYAWCEGRGVRGRELAQGEAPRRRPTRLVHGTRQRSHLARRAHCSPGPALHHALQQAVWRPRRAHQAVRGCQQAHMNSRQERGISPRVAPELPHPSPSLPPRPPLPPCLPSAATPGWNAWWQRTRSTAASRQCRQGRVGGRNGLGWVGVFVLARRVTCVTLPSSLGTGCGGAGADHCGQEEDHAGRRRGGTQV